MSLLETLYNIFSHLSTVEINRFGDKLHMLRIQRRMTLKELARALGHSAHGYVSELEANKKKPTIEYVLGISALFGVSTETLLKDELEIPNDEKFMTPPLAGG